MQSETIRAELAGDQAPDETYESLKRNAQAYKLDDPANGTDTNYPPESLLNSKR